MTEFTIFKTIKVIKTKLSTNINYTSGYSNYNLLGRAVEYSKELASSVDLLLYILDTSNNTKGIFEDSSLSEGTIL